jgi:flagellar biosynthesis protein FlhA
VAEHLEQVIRGRAAEILTREEVSRLVSDLKRRAPSLVDELIPETLKVGEVHKVLQGLLRERVSIRDLETILETLADHGDRTRDAAELTEHARRSVARTICASIADRDGTIHSLLLDPPLEEVLQGALEKTERGTRLALEPEMVDALAEAVAGALGPFDASGRPQVLACPAAIRPHLRAFLAARTPLLLVLAYEEIAGDFRLEEHGAVSLPKETWSRR